MMDEEDIEENRITEVPTNKAVQCLFCGVPLYIGVIAFNAACVGGPSNVFHPVFVLTVACTSCHDKFIAPNVSDQKYKEGVRISFLAGLPVDSRKM